MLLSKPIRPGVTLLYHARSWPETGAGIFAIVFSLVMLLHPDGWSSGEVRDGVARTADPNIVRAIGAAIGLFGLYMIFGKTCYLVNRPHGLLTKQFSLIVPLGSTTYSLADFSSVAIDYDSDDGESKRMYRLRLVGPNRSLTLSSGRTKDQVRRSKKAVLQSTGLPSRIEPGDDD